MNIKIPVDHGHLEGDLRLPEAEPTAVGVVCHPHPVHGGTLHTKAVFRAAQALNEIGCAVVRFNFRGVGGSTGSYDEGIGEQDDARAALNWVVERYSGLPAILGGFSFGSMVVLSVGVEDDRVVGLLGLGLPLEMYDFSFLRDAGKPVLIVQGDEDEFTTGAEIAARGEEWGNHVTVRRIAGTDHYFNGRFDELREAVREGFSGRLERSKGGTHAQP